MRAAENGHHISGAERLVSPTDLPELSAAMTLRALSHDKGVPDTINITMERVDETTIRTVAALEPVQVTNASPDTAKTLITHILKEAGVAAADQAVEFVYSLTGLRGAAIVDSATGHRIDPNPARGVRVSCFDAISRPDAHCGKNHFQEALTLASKVASAPGIIAEVCISDDPHYTQGYVAAQGKYFRIPNMKSPGSALGTRIFIADPHANLDELIEYLENCPVRVDLPPLASSQPVASPQSQPAAAATIHKASLSEIIQGRNTQWANDGLARTLRTFTSPQIPRSTIDGKDYLLFSSSDYLGFSTHPMLIDAAISAIHKLGTGSGGSRLTTGTSIHSELENRLAQFFGREDAVLFSTGYQANHSTISAIATEEVAIFSDSGNHASIIDGCRAAKGQVMVFPHLDYSTLDTLLASSTARHKLVISDSVFSMSGEVIDAKALEGVCRRHGAWLMLDDAHGVGVLGDRGRGAAYHGGIHPDIVVGTASKALGVEGGFVLCDAEVGTFLRNRARSFVYSTSMNPGSVKAIEAALELLQQGERLSQLRVNIAAVRKLLALPEDDNASAIIPLRVGDEDQAVQLSAALAHNGIYIPAIRYPTVPRGEAMLRLTVTALHTASDIDQLGNELRRLGII